MEITPQNVNSIARSLGQTLIKAGYKMIVSAFNIQPKLVFYNEIVNLISTKLNCESSLLDSNYYLIDFVTWKDIIACDWLVDTKKWIADKFDCDNWSYAFASHISELFDISVACMYGEIFNKDTKKSLGYHYWNTILTKELDGLHLYFYEPENNQYVEIIGQSQIIIGNWIYKQIKIIVF